MGTPATPSLLWVPRPLSATFWFFLPTPGSFRSCLGRPRPRWRPKGTPQTSGSLSPLPTHLLHPLLPRKCHQPCPPSTLTFVSPAQLSEPVGFPSPGCSLRTASREEVWAIVTVALVCVPFTRNLGQKCVGPHLWEPLPHTPPLAFSLLKAGVTAGDPSPCHPITVRVTSPVPWPCNAVITLGHVPTEVSSRATPASVPRLATPPRSPGPCQWTVVNGSQELGKQVSSLLLVRWHIFKNRN